ncbi:MAG TPA: hypothetical protein VNU46_07420 [Gemmatimonadaceae bacterium]|nr:hypothetical protein [Gemmatimonadaceae bacterium]
MKQTTGTIIFTLGTTALLAATPNATHAQQAVNTGQSIDTVSGTAKENSVLNLVVRSLVWRGDSLVIDSSTTAVLAAVPDSLMSIQAFSQAQIMQVAMGSNLSSHASSPDVPIVLEPGAPTIIVDGKTITDRSFTLHVLKIRSVAAFKGGNGQGTKNGTIKIEYNP